MSWMDGVALWDHHCHALLSETYQSDLDRLARCLTEAPADYPLEDIHNGIVFHQALAVVANHLDVPCDMTLVKQALGSVDYEDYCRQLFNESGYARLLVDTGYTPAGAWPLEVMENALGIPVAKILRLETLAEDILATAEDFDEGIDRYQRSLKKARQDGYVGAKSIIAYRSGLHVIPTDKGRARAQFLAMRHHGERRLVNPDLLNYLLYLATPILMDQNLPLQFHTGFGDPDTDLLQGNPLLLRPYIEEFVPQGHRIALLHTYPYHREAGYLASVYPGIYVDVSLALPLAASGSSRILHEALELTPLSRLLFASDSHSRPESYFLAAKFFKEGMNAFLDDAVKGHQVLPSVAEEWAQGVAMRNAQKLYGFK